MPAVFQPDDLVVYLKQKNSVHPGPNARDIHPAPTATLIPTWLTSFGG